MTATNRQATAHHLNSLLVRDFMPSGLAHSLDMLKVKMMRSARLGDPAGRRQGRKIAGARVDGF